MKIINTAITDVKIIEPEVYADSRGFFFESYNHRQFEEAIGRTIKFVQDNHSCSNKGVLRGLHYQLDPHAQGKLVRCVKGEVYDVAVDIRRDSPTFKQWVGVKLSADNKLQMWIPEGFAHGFITISDSAEFLYKTTDYWYRELDRSIAWNDSELAIDWPLQQEPLLSSKDLAAPTLSTSLSSMHSH
jgi:dTDP-4-dehydrorhamnose 3,5-epimerase